MEHLSTLALARLVEETPDADEARHLESCAACKVELTALREQTESLARLPDLRPPMGDWAALEARLVSDGLVRRRTFLGSLATTPPWMRVAAAALLFVGGGAVGAGLADNAPETATPDLVPAFSDAASHVSSPEEAAELVMLAERNYMDALVLYRQFAGLDGSPEVAEDTESRFAAIEGIVLASRAAVRQAPTDPFLNGVLVSALAERQAVLRRISSGSTANWF